MNRELILSINTEQPLWQALGLAADPICKIDICSTVVDRLQRTATFFSKSNRLNNLTGRVILILINSPININIRRPHGYKKI